MSEEKKNDEETQKFYEENKEMIDRIIAQKTELETAISDGNDNIDTAANIDAVNTALENAKATVDAIKTDAQLTAEELDW